MLKSVEKTTANFSNTKQATTASCGPSLYTPTGELNWKLISFILLILLFLLMGVTIGTEILRPKNVPTLPDTSSPTSSQSATVPTPTISLAAAKEWQTYINTDFGFQLKYPANWTYYESKIASSSSIFFFRPLSPSPLNPKSGIVSVEIEMNSNTSLTYDKIISSICDGPSVCASPQKAVEVMVGGIKAKKLINPPLPIDSERVIVINFPYIFQLSVWLDNSYQQQYSLKEKKKIFDQMLDSFRFHNITSSPAVTATPNAVSLSQTTIDFSSCNEGSNFLKAGTSRSVTLTIIKDEGDTCQLEITSEVEGTKTTSLCQVPKSLATVEFTLSNYGADFSAIKPYCREITSPSKY